MKDAVGVYCNQGLVQTRTKKAGAEMQCTEIAPDVSLHALYSLHKLQAKPERRAGMNKITEIVHFHMAHWFLRISLVSRKFSALRLQYEHQRNADGKYITTNVSC